MNKQKLFLSFSILFIAICVNAQKMEYFADKNSEDIKVESLQGMAVTFSPVRNGLSSFPPPTQISYFNENRIGIQWTLYKAIGLTNSYHEFTDYSFNVISPKNSIYSLSVDALIEPRWYFLYRYSASRGKTPKLNSGFFLSFPLEYSVQLLQFIKIKNPAYNYNAYYSVINFTPSLGYRYALSDHFLLDAKVGIGGHINVGQNMGLNQELDYNFKIGAAYKF